MVEGAQKGVQFRWCMSRKNYLIRALNFKPFDELRRWTGLADTPYTPRDSVVHKKQPYFRAEQSVLLACRHSNSCALWNSRATLQVYRRHGCILFGRF